ncbi:MAG: Rossmann-like and DUF2520 domain-containing protein [Pyrinomonadaceae bacterium]
MAVNKNNKKSGALKSLSRSATVRARDEKSEREAARAPKPTVSIIGGGRLGSALALALQACGYFIEAIVARRLNHARRVTRILDSPSTRSLSAAQLDELPHSELTFITTPDDSIAATAARLAARVEKNEKSARRKTALHMSGALSSAVLQPLGDVGYSIASLHPLIAVSDPARGAESLRNAFYCIEGERKATATARKIVKEFGAQSFSIDAKDKTLYHAAAVTASGHLVALFDTATEMLAHCGLTKARAREVLLPLVRSTIENLSTREPSRALTGSFARADVATIRQHLDALRAHASPHELHDALEVYILLGAHSLRLAQENGAPVAALIEISRALEQAKRGRKTKV